jgi:pimeloyl-ACP methyl ester carboxylesterase
MASAVSMPPPEIQRADLVLIINLVLNNADFLFWLMEKIGMNAILRSVGISPDARIRLAQEHPDIMERLRELVRFAPLSLRRAGMVNDADWASKFERLPIERITTPTLVVHGTADHIMPFAHGEWVANTVPDATLLPLEGGGHLSFVSHHATTMPALHDFLRQHTP